MLLLVVVGRGTLGFGLDAFGGCRCCCASSATTALGLILRWRHWLGVSFSGAATALAGLFGRHFVVLFLVVHLLLLLVVVGVKMMLLRLRGVVVVLLVVVNFFGLRMVGIVGMQLGDMLLLLLLRRRREGRLLLVMGRRGSGDVVGDDGGEI